MIHMRWSRLFTMSANLALCLALALSFAPAGWAGQVLAEEAEDEVMYLPLMLKKRIPFIESTGVLDTSFGADGWLMANIGGSYERVGAAVAQTDGKIVIVGTLDLFTDDFAVARYNPDGSLDTSFSDDGKVITDFSYRSDNANAVALQPWDNKIVVAGLSSNAMALARYNPDGSLDSSFGDGGMLLTYFAAGTALASSVAVQADGKIVAAGWAGDIDELDFVLARYLPDGTLDTSFSGDGMVVTDFFGGSDCGAAIAIDPDSGKIIVAGESYYYMSTDIAIARYNPDGSLDTTFSSDGRVLLDLGGMDGAAAMVLQEDGRMVVAGDSDAAGTSDIVVLRFGTNGLVEASEYTDFDGNADFALAVALQEDDKIVVAGFSYSESTASGDFAVARYTVDINPDTTFSQDGKLTSDFSGDHDVGKTVLVQAGGSIVVAGMIRGATDDFALARYTSDGSLDASFGDDGWAVTELAGSQDEANAIALQPDGRIILAGYSTGLTQDFALARLNPDGSLDATFAGNGRLTTDFSDDVDNARAVALQADGKIVVAGGTGSSSNIALARYNPNGSLDTTFDLDGKLVIDLGGDYEGAYAVALQEDNKIVVAGNSNANASYDFALARLNPDGSLDSTFDGDGKLLIDFAGDLDIARAIVLQPDEKIIVVGYAFTTASYQFALARLNPDGSLDTGFNGTGKLLSDVTSDSDTAHAVVLQPDGKIVAMGSNFDDFIVVRYNPNGSLDTGFDGDGIIVTDFEGRFDSGQAIALQPNGKIVVAGYDFGVSDSYFSVLARYNPDGSLDASFAGSGLLVIDIAGSEDYSYTMALQPDGKILVAGVSSNGIDYDFTLARIK